MCHHHCVRCYYNQIPPCYTNKVDLRQSNPIAVIDIVRLERTRSLLQLNVCRTARLCRRSALHWMRVNLARNAAAKQPPHVKLHHERRQLRSRRREIHVAATVGDKDEHHEACGHQRTELHDDVIEIEAGVDGPQELACNEDDQVQRVRQDCQCDAVLALAFLGRCGGEDGDAVEAQNFGEAGEEDETIAAEYRDNGGSKAYEV